MTVNSQETELFLDFESKSYKEYDFTSYNNFTLYDKTQTTCRSISMMDLLKYPESYIKILCDYELKYNNNRTIVLNCNESAILAITHFYKNGEWDSLYVQEMEMYDIIPKQYEGMKYSLEFVFNFLQLPSCYQEEDVKKYYRTLVTKEAKQNKKKKNKNKFKRLNKPQLEEKFVNEYYSGIPEEYHDEVDQSDVDQYVREQMSYYYDEE